MKYQIICYSDPVTICDKVEELMKKGWQPQGGIAVVSHPDNKGLLDKSRLFFYQAMVKPEPPAKQRPARLTGRELY